MYRIFKLMFTALAIITLWAFAGCYYDKEEFLYPDVLDCSTATYAFTKDVQPLITLHCAYAGCHDATNAGGLTLTSYAQVKATATSINQRVVVQKNMPPAGGLTAAEISIIKCWIANNTPQ